MAAKLDGKRVAILATDGVEEVEYTKPRAAVEAAGGTAELISLGKEPIRSVNHLDTSTTYEVDRAVADADPVDYDALVLPGGVANPDFLRADANVVRFVRTFVESGKPVAAICHGPWTLVEANVVRGRTLTSWPSLRTDLVNAGATWVDQEVFVDNGLITSRRPRDLPAFCATLINEIADGGTTGSTT